MGRSKHFEDIKEFKDVVSAKGTAPGKWMSTGSVLYGFGVLECRLCHVTIPLIFSILTWFSGYTGLLMRTLLHLADISNPAKPLDLAKIWYDSLIFNSRVTIIPRTFIVICDKNQFTGQEGCWMSFSYRFFFIKFSWCPWLEGIWSSESPLSVSDFWFGLQGDIEKSLGLPVSPQVSSSRLWKTFQCRISFSISFTYYALNAVLDVTGYCKTQHYLVPCLNFHFQCDKETTSIQRSQVGFITFIVLPAFKVCSVPAWYFWIYSLCNFSQRSSLVFFGSILCVISVSY